VCRRTQQDPDQLHGIHLGVTLSVVLEMNISKSPCLSSAGQRVVKRKSLDSSPACLCQVLRSKNQPGLIYLKKGEQGWRLRTSHNFSTTSSCSSTGSGSPETDNNSPKDIIVAKEYNLRPKEVVDYSFLPITIFIKAAHPASQATHVSRILPRDFEPQTPTIKTC